MNLSSWTRKVLGRPDVFDKERPLAALEGKTQARLLAISAESGETLLESRLDSSPVFDGLIAASGALCLSLEDGSVVCLSKKR